MPRRTRLRRRLFVMTALNAAILIGITLLLTSRERDSHRLIHRLLVVDARAVAALEEGERAQAAFTAELVPLLADPLGDPWRAVTAFRRVAQLIGRRELAPDDYARLAPLARDLSTSLTDAANGWPAMTTEKRREAAASLVSESKRYSREMTTLREARQSAIERDMPDLESSATNTMLVALGLVYIVVIFSFVVVKLALAKVVAPLEGLTRATSKIQQGDYSQRVAISGDHEVAELGSRFNEMMDSLSRMAEQLAHQARTDELTGLPNFRSFQSAIELEIERADRYEQRFGVLVFDLDHFKRYNDTHGHAAGNDALKSVAVVIRKALRAADTPARYGGEEFAVIVPQIDAAGLAVIAERIRRGVEELPVPPGRTPLTVSVGGALFPADGRTTAALFKAADERLYEAKGAGRNRVVTPKAAREARLIS